jgi:hypothetical protein
MRAPRHEEILAYGRALRASGSRVDFGEVPVAVRDRVGSLVLA